MPDRKPVLILGGGINGAAIARELALQQVDFILVDSADLASGATAYSSRLIHGGLRYLEYAELGLVRESLRERAILLKTAPELVQPLRFYIPVEHRLTGMLGATSRFLHLPWKPSQRPRGRYVVQLGLALYDWFSRTGTGSLPGHAVHRLPSEPSLPAVTRPGTRWLLSYSDAQVKFPERFTIALLKDAVAVGSKQGTQAEVLPYHRAELRGDEVTISPVDTSITTPPRTMKIAAVINATGAWVDQTLAKLNISSARLIGGTKGSHFFTWQPRLREQLRGQAVYAEAADGRPVFVLPFGEGTLVGTTDVPFEGDPATAVTSEAELTYLLQVVNELFPAAEVQRSDILLHGCGVRPLPYVGSKTPAGVTRRHWLHWHQDSAVPLLSVIGGKLTTCRSLAEETAQALAPKLGTDFTPGLTRSRVFPAEPQLPAAANLAEITPENILPIVQREFVTRLEDLIERRLMWLFDPTFNRASLERLTDVMLALGKVTADSRNANVERVLQRLQSHFGRVLK